MSTNDTSTIRDLLSKNQWIDAIKVLENFPTPLPDEQLATLAWCYSRAGQYDKSIRRYDEALFCNTPNPAHNGFKEETYEGTDHGRK